MIPPVASLLGVNVTILDTNGLLEAIDKLLGSGRKRLVCASGNVQSLNLSAKLEWYRDFLNGADIVRLDGFGVWLGARILGHECPPRSTWADFGWPLAELCGRRGYKLFLFGGIEGVAQQAAARLVSQNSTLQVVGVQNGYIDVSQESKENQLVIRCINDSGADILIVGLGMPAQERWLADNLASLNVGMVMTGGAVFEYLSGTKRRAPHWMRNCGLEWLYRLLQEPGRLGRRYLVGNAFFLWRLSGAAWSSKMGIKRARP